MQNLLIAASVYSLKSSVLPLAFLYYLQIISISFCSVYFLILFYCSQEIYEAAKAAVLKQKRAVSISELLSMFLLFTVIFVAFSSLFLLYQSSINIYYI